uniref:Uncharacterized protein n=1 Tax=Tanacetum cinerariifolium TaxID=118510 RepID=A0A6L2MEC5_TANCI|nr:hypothetical protein [Tanacetum cinerariifolium]
MRTSKHGESRPYALSWKSCQGDSLNLPDHRKNHAVSDKSSPLKTLVTLLLLTASRESRASHYDRVVPKRKYLRFLRWVEAEMVSLEVEIRNAEDFSYIRCVLPLMYQLMVVKKTSFLEMKCSGGRVESIPDVIEDSNKALSDT